MMAMPVCVGCGKIINSNRVAYCVECGRPLCIACSSTGLCPDCEEVRESEEDVADIEEW